MARRPSFQFYPADWRNDSGLSLCSLSARGLWIELICLMHNADVYGHLRSAGRPLNAKDVARLVGAEVREVTKCLGELERNEVLSRSEDGTIYSRRMVRDEDLRNRRAEGGQAGAAYGHFGAEHGKKGGRPRKQRGDQEPPFKPAPSSSSSSSSSEHSVHSVNAQGAAVNLDVATPAPPEKPAPKRINGVQPKKTANRFAEFWACYPVKKGKPEAEKKWKSKGLDALADQIIAHVRMMEAEDDQWKRGFIPHGSTYVNGELWNDEPFREKDTTAATAPPPQVMGAKAALARTENPLEAAIGYIRQQHGLGVYGEGEHGEAEMRRLIAEATEKHRANGQHPLSTTQGPTR